MGKFKDRLLCTHKPGIIFVHIPKTGGSSISASLRKHYRLSKFNIKSEVTSLAAQKRFDIAVSDPGYEEKLQGFRQSLIFYEAQKGTRYITGHVWIDLNILTLKQLDYSIITCLRDPVDRWYSHYLYGRFKEGSHGKIEMDIDEFLSSSLAENFGSTYVKYIGGTRNDKDYTTPPAVSQAVANLDIFDLLGFLQGMDGFRKSLEARTGFGLRPQHRRKTPADPELVKRIKGSAEIRKEVEKLCSPDREVYEQALLRFSLDSGTRTAE